jgi:hypothetical protein
MSGTPVLRIHRFRPLAVGIDVVLRNRLAELRALPGLLDVAVGRQGPDELGPRVLASVWESEAAMPPPLGRALGDVADAAIEVAPIRVLFRADAGVAPRIIRVFRGRVRPGELARYVEEVRVGTAADDAAGHGPLALYLAESDAAPDGFVTLSTWTSWPAVEAATGGDVNRPVATRHPERIASADVTHYEGIEG